MQPLFGYLYRAKDRIPDRRTMLNAVSWSAASWTPLPQLRVTLLVADSILHSTGSLKLGYTRLSASLSLAPLVTMMLPTVQALFDFRMRRITEAGLWKLKFFPMCGNAQNDPNLNPTSWGYNSQICVWTSTVNTEATNWGQAGAVWLYWDNGGYINAGGMHNTYYHRMQVRLAQDE